MLLSGKGQGENEHEWTNGDFDRHDGRWKRWRFKSSAIAFGSGERGK